MAHLALGGLQGLTSAGLSSIGTILLSVLTALVGFGLGRGVPRLVQRSGRLARRNRGSQLVFGGLLLLPWLVGIVLLAMLPLGPHLLLPAIDYAIGMGQERRTMGLLEGRPQLYSPGTSFLRTVTRSKRCPETRRSSSPENS
jgi:hypothetical protein